MPATILNGKSIAKQIKTEIAAEVADFKRSTGNTPTLAAVLVGEDPASQVYVRSKAKDCERVGIESQVHRLPEDTSQDDLLSLLDQLNNDTNVNGILVQLPLPDTIDEKTILDAVDPLKDVDAFHPENVGLISQERPRFLPCTPHGIMQILHRSGIAASGKEVVVIGRSEIVGKPIAMMLSQRNSPLGHEAVNATVTICHSRTPDLAAVTRRADILIAAIGRAKFITNEMVKPGATIIDVGINRTDDGLVGDVDFEDVKEVAGHITPVPGGVGPLTRAMLLHNTLAATISQVDCQS